jgi:chemotaxis protein histidine kinase CheA
MLGDGRVALILDVATVLRDARLGGAHLPTPTGTERCVV